MAEDPKDLVRVPQDKPTAIAVRGTDDRFYSEFEEESPISLRDYWRIIRKHKWLILGIIVMVTTSVTIWTFKQIPQYRAVTTVQLDPPSLNLLNFKDIVNENATFDASNPATQIRVLMSRVLARRVADQLDLTHDPDMAGRMTARGFSRKPSVPPEPAGALSSIPPVPSTSTLPEDAVTESVVEKLIGGLQVSQIRNTRVLQISYESPHPQSATQIANAYANAFIDYTLESRYNATQRASEWLMKQSEDLKIKLEKSEEALGEYAQKNGIVYLDPTPGEGGGGGQNTAVQQLSALNGAVTQAQGERIKIEALYREVHSPNATEITLFRESSLIKSLNEKLTSLSQLYAGMSAKFEPGWPALPQVKVQIDQVKQQIIEEKKRIIKTIDTEYFSSLNQERSFRAAFEKQKAEVNDLNDKQIHYNILKREVDTNRQLYEGLLQRLKEAGISAGLKSSNIRILDPAEVPRAPYSPNKQKNIALGFLVSVFSALGFAFLLERLDTSIKTPDQVERHLRLPSLAMIPALQIAAPRRLLTGRDGQPASEKRAVVDLISQSDPKAMISEAYRSLRTSILLSTNSHPPKSILVTSSGPGEGKTVTVANLGITLAQLGGKILILDCDMRRPRLHKIFETPKENPGFSAFLSGNSKLTPLIFETKIPDLYVIPGGPTPPNPSELIGSDIMRQSLELLAAHFDHVIIDSPPVMSVTDATILSTLVDGVVLVIHGAKTNRDVAARATQRLRDVGARVIGSVLNNVDVKSADYDYYYHQYYYYSEYTDEKKSDQKSS